MRNGDITIPGWFLAVSGAVVTLLISANVFFVKRLVDQLDATREIVWQLRQDVVILKVTVDNISLRHREYLERLIKGDKK